jgi:hypothetical protein
MEKLQMHQNAGVYKKAVEVIEGFFQTEENENDDLIAAIKAITQQQPATLNF